MARWQWFCWDLLPYFVRMLGLQRTPEWPADDILYGMIPSLAPSWERDRKEPVCEMEAVYLLPVDGN